MLGSAKTNLPLLNLTSWVKGTSSFLGLRHHIAVVKKMTNNRHVFMLSYTFFGYFFRGKTSIGTNDYAFYVNGCIVWMWSQAVRDNVCGICLKVCIFASGLCLLIMARGQWNKIHLTKSTKSYKVLQSPPQGKVVWLPQSQHDGPMTRTHRLNGNG